MPIPQPVPGDVEPDPRRHGDAVVVERLTKRYGARVAVDEVSFAVPTGSVAGLIGPNGAGKTTIMAMLLGLVRPTSGSATVLGHPIDRPFDYLDRVGALIEGPAFHPAVSGADNLRSLAVLGGHDRDRAPGRLDIAGLLELVGLADRGDDRYGAYSLGMKQRLGIAAALLGDPDVVVLDEPTNGLDPAGMQDIRRLIGEIAAGGRTVVVSSHLLGELEQVCDWLIVVDHGGLVYLGDPDGLAGSEAIVVRPADAGHLATLHSMVQSTHLPVTSGEGELVVTLTGDVDAAALAAEINRRAHAAGVLLAELHHRRPDLETRYLSLVADAGVIAEGPTAIDEDSR